ncbi:polymer-forming cytoskeletal protein [Oceanicaulis sp. MMSF_3324]|uniref:polymer-forming cytoskeletal protein n=1 Tax=Oceanicaulis sp. MMSF_3324 TaxID=3046702 RepID=UPI00273E0B03|nr:polymer-forming cytoskeletal protein [Oceanicaulis sp. MMSF_3324]
MLKSLKKYMGSLLVAGFLCGAASGAAHAGQYIGGDLNLSLDENDDVLVLAADVIGEGRVGGDLTVFAADVRMNVTVDGEVQIVAADIELDGAVDGEVGLAGADIRVGADIFDDLDAAGADLTLNGTVAGNAALAGATVIITADAIVSGETEIGARELYMEGRLERGAEIHARDVVISGTIEGPLDIRARDVVIESGAVLTGPITVRSPKPPSVAEGAQIGELDYQQYEFDDNSDFDHPNVNIGIDDFGFAPSPWAFGGVFTASAFLLGLLVSLASPKGVASIASAFRRQPWVSGLLGLVVLAMMPILIPTLMVLLAVTVIGIPLAILLGLATPIFMFLAFAFGGIAIGDLVMNRTGEPAGFGLRAGSMLAALLVIGLISVIPFIGWAISMIVFCIGLGAWTIALFTRTKPQPNMDAV